MKRAWLLFVAKFFIDFVMHYFRTCLYWPKTYTDKRQRSRTLWKLWRRIHRGFQVQVDKRFPYEKDECLETGKSQNEVMPSIRMTKNQHLSICASINGDKNWKHCYQHPIDNINQEYHVVVTQGFFVREKLMFMVLIDNEMVYARDNPKPLIFNGTLHLTSPWIHSLGTFGALSDLKVYMRPYPINST